MQQEGSSQSQQSAKQQVVERIKNATNILVTVSTNPSVDELSAALGLTVMLNKLDKHATAVFSGSIPPAIDFLKPDKTFEGTVDSLRDFIIALDKEKADRLRYKVEDDVVRIFITPYRTTITDADLQFSQGDFNVELIIALGVDKREDLDSAIAAHGRILHDASVATINTNADTSSLGNIDWHDANASSLCEMLMSLSEALQANIVDEQIATALLTGIVAATDRFSNQKTTPRVMTMSAQLMAAGANQQLIATQLEMAHEVSPRPAVQPDGSTRLSEGASSRVNQPSPAPQQQPPKSDGELQVDHEQEAVRQKARDDAQARAEEAARAAELEKGLQNAAASQPTVPTLDDLAAQLAAAQTPPAAAPLISPAPAPSPAADTPPRQQITSRPSWMEKRIEPPTMGSALSATSEQALADKVREEEESRNHQLLSHDAPAESPQPEQLPVDVTQPPVPQQQEQPPVAPSFDSLGLDYEEAPLPAPAVAPADPSTPHAPTLAELEAQAHAKAAADLAAPATHVASDVDQARQAVTNAFDSSEAPGDTAQTPPLSLDASEPATALPPLPDFSTLPPLPQDAPLMPPPPPSIPQESPLDQATDPYGQASTPAVPQSSDPSQFRIPGQ